jgi:hypothetical protein
MRLLVNEMATSALDKIFEMIDDLSPSEKQQVVDHITESVQTETDTPPDDLVWTEEELAELLKPGEPLTGRQMIEAGVFGVWKDLDIEDSVEWLAQQRARRRDKFKW